MSPILLKDWIMPRLPNLLRTQFQRNYLFFSGADPMMFASPEASGEPHLLYAIYQSMIAAYLVFLSIYSGFASKHGVKVFIYFTYWNLYLCSLTFIMKAYHAWQFYQKYRDNKEKRPTDLSTGMKFQWVLYNITCSGGIIVAILYWLVLYHPGKTTSFLGINTHGVLASIILMDIFITAIPVRLLHAWMSSVYAALFSMFCFFYWQAGGKNTKDKPYIYSVIDFSNNWEMALICIFSLIFFMGPLLHTFLFCIHLLRRTIYNRMSCLNREKTLLHEQGHNENCEMQQTSDKETLNMNSV
ncbi:protein rolling stone [Octopus bimaculoides]|nr:protein rolling stone [Octopus bimaculoides]|eukprot:XP_014777193.1 PREDICTED: protein rolling stone-like [Octopus bimaculoides]